ncbi:aspartate aminotransferase family protein [Martelella alba]|uniref:Aminotransferase class III-fold pyridoxal phosphate-dependent enzyme n=1 Tax=Martelella alba TaxID=2590451 RepID=A0ABY2SEU2_9HYPH|nr:aminotransferase class III-fold pyridoxal phosphate-dependent enzyme [Martelella alba]TKI03363.1 aminotransferase class III-fold pyridoxal phosphate-dependent enzyme [Martelella alba]
MKEYTDSDKVGYLRDIDRKYLSWGDTVHYQENPIIAKNCYKHIVEDLEGRKYIDTQMWHSSCNFGYKNEFIDRRVSDKLRDLPQVSGDFLHEEKLLLAKAVCDAIYERTGVAGRVSFNASGTLVVEDALKIVRKNTQRNKVAAMTGAYHGRSLTVSGISSSHRYRQYYGEFADRAILFPFANCAHCYYEKQPHSCGCYCGKMIKKSMDTDFYGICSEDSNEIGAVFLEMCQGRGYTIPPRDFYQKFVPEMQKRGILVVDDEIQVGMYRTGKLFAFEHFGITPDIITLSKSFTNGLSPISMVWARDDLVNPENFSPGHAHSNFANHPLGTTAALAAWEYMMGQNYQETLPAKSDYYLAGLRKLKEKYSFIHSVDGLGMLFNIVFADPSGRPYKNAGKYVVTAAQDQDYHYRQQPWRLILNSGGYWNEGLKLAPYLDISQQEIDLTLALLDQVLETFAARRGDDHEMRCQQR